MGCMCSTDPLKFRGPGRYICIIIPKSEESIFPLLSFFVLGCVWCVCTIAFCHIIYIYTYIFIYICMNRLCWLSVEWLQWFERRQSTFGHQPSAIGHRPSQLPSKNEHTHTLSLSIYIYIEKRDFFPLRPCIMQTYLSRNTWKCFFQLTHFSSDHIPNMST